MSAEINAASGVQSVNGSGDGTAEVGTDRADEVAELRRQVADFPTTTVHLAEAEEPNGWK